MKRLLIATDAFLPRWDGIARYLHEVLPGLEKHFDITVIAPRFPDYHGKEEQDKKYKIKRVSSLKFSVGDYNPPGFHLKLIKEEVKKADIVWTHAIMPIGMAAMHYGKKYGKIVVDTIHSYEWELAKNSLSRFNPFKKLAFFLARIIANHFYNKCNMLMVPDKETAEILSYNNISVPSTIIHLGTDTRVFCPPKDKRKAKENVGIIPERKVIGYAGRLGREKDIGTLIRAFHKIHAEDKNVELLIAGKGIREYEKMLRDHSHIKFFGETNEIEKYFQAMDIYVLPSLTETTSLSTMEAMSCGVPAVVTKVGFIKQYIQDNVQGKFVPKQNPLVLSLVIKRLLKDDTARLAMGQLARRTILERFTWKKTQQEIRKLFQRL